MSRSTRPGWLAVGAASAALVIVQLGLPAASVVGPALIATVGATLWPTGVGAARPGPVTARRAGRSPIRIGIAALAAGALLVAVRTCAAPPVQQSAPVGVANTLHPTAALAGVRR